MVDRSKQSIFVKYRQLLALIFIAVGLVLGVIFFETINVGISPAQYFEKSFYNQFGPIAICVELLIAGIHLFLKHSKTNFTLALFGFTAVLDPVLNLTGIFSTNVPLYGTLIFIILAIPAFWISFTNTFNLGRISYLAAFGSFVSGVIIELFFNYW